MLMLGALSASADEGSPGHSHRLMHKMMDRAHGRGTSDRMHRVEGAEQMMEQCSQMHEQMEGMMSDGMMGGGMMDMMRP